MPILAGKKVETILPMGSAPLTWTFLTDVSIPATSSAKLIDSEDSSIRVVRIVNLAGNDTMRIGEADVGASKGIPLAAGDTLELATNQALYAYNPGSGAESVSVSYGE